MDLLRVSLACFLLVMTFDPILARILCKGCSKGYFVKVNCSTSQGSIRGVQCRPCTNCSALKLETLHQCSTYADSVCVNKSSPIVTSPKPVTESPPDQTVVIIVGVLLVFVLLLGLALTPLLCRGCCYSTVKGNTLPLHDKLLPQQDKTPASCSSQQRSGPSETEMV